MEMKYGDIALGLQYIPQLCIHDAVCVLTLRRGTEVAGRSSLQGLVSLKYLNSQIRVNQGEFYSL